MCEKEIDTFIYTINENDDIPVVDESSDSDNEAITVSKKSKVIQNKKKAAEFNEEFKFLVDDENNEKAFERDIALEWAKKKHEITTLDEKIASARRKRKFVEINEDNTQELDEEDISESDVEENFQDKLRTKEKKLSRKKKKQFENETTKNNEKIKFSQEIDDYDDTLCFSDMNLSRPLLKALSLMNFTKPTPIQAACIPIALMGKDICACAATGTGKTAAFMLPTLERLLFKPSQAPTTRVLVLTPTRELAVQIFQVTKQLAVNINVNISLSAGGMDVKTQEAALRLGPDIVIATPGRLIDHLHNAPNFHLNSVEILILDEADRMLDEYFADQMKEVIRLCSTTRQTMLFSATMTEGVKDLAAVSLNKPLKIFMNQNTDVAFNLRQEFIRIRPGHEGDREAIVLALLKRTFHSQVILFIQTKKQAHRMHILLGLAGIKCAELHGNLSQAQRLQSLSSFKHGEVDILIATDVAARGLDIDGVRTIINFTMPNSLSHYIHRVGRTARAGKTGRSVSLAGEDERKLLKEIVKKAKLPVKSRVLPINVLKKYREKIEILESDISMIEEQEDEEKEIRSTENKINKAQNLLEGNTDKQKRDWFQTHQERQLVKEKMRLSMTNDDLKKRNKKGKKQPLKEKLSAEDRVNRELSFSQAYSIRSAKKESRPKRIRAYEEDQQPLKKQKKKLKNKVKKNISNELTNIDSKSVKKLRTGANQHILQKSKKKGKTFNSKGRYKRR